LLYQIRESSDITGKPIKNFLRRRLAIMRTKQTARKSCAGRMRLKKDKQTETITQVSFMNEMSARTQDNKTFRRREDVMIKISNASCLDETIILVDMILCLSLYYLVNDLVHLSNLTINGVSLPQSVGLILTIF
jgi:hypothetical protein